MLTKLREISKFKNPAKHNISSKITAIQNDLNEGLYKVMDKAFTNGKLDALNSNFTFEETDKIIERYAQKNMIIAAATSAVPGPFGILGSIPELLMNFYNQMNMIYDLGCAYGKESFINKDVLLDIPIAAFGGNTNLTQLQNNKMDLKDSAESLLMNKAEILGKSIVERTLKKSVVQFLPVAGPILIGTWSKMATRKISRISINFLDDQMDYTEKHTPEENVSTKRLLQIEKIKGLVNLIEANNEINENQIDLIGTIIENSVLSESEKEYYLQESLKIGSKFELDKSLLEEYEEADDLIVEMVIMAKRSGEIDKDELGYIYQVGQSLGIEEEFIDELI